MAKTPKAAPPKFPKSMGACADLLHELKTQRLAAQKIVDDLATKETALKDYIISSLPKDDTGASGKNYRVTVGRTTVPKIEDWEAFYKHVKKTGHFELMQKRLSDAAIMERWDAGKQVPGVGTFQKVSVSLNKI